MSTAESPTRVAFETPRGRITTSDVLDTDERLDNVHEHGTLLQVRLTDTSTLWISATEAVPVDDAELDIAEPSQPDLKGP